MTASKAMTARVAHALMNRRIWIVVGLLALAAAIWLIGPLVAIGVYRPLEGVAARLIVIVAIVGLCVARATLLRWRAARVNAQLLAQLQGGQAQPAARETEQAPHVEELRNRFDEAARLLKTVRLGHAAQRGGALSHWFDAMTRRYLYELPWYVFIGAPGSGKTTALVNSGLSFPLAEQFGRAAVRGVGGTRHCDWWFTNEAVLIDTAGRYTTHESNRVLDEDEWKGFLGLLKKYRAKQPLNGALLTISVSDLLGASEVERTEHAMSLRKRLQELRAELGIRLPVYVLVTKADLLAGFSEYFANLGRAERTQVWGFTFPLAEAGAPGFDLRAAFDREYRLLHRRLNEALPELLSAEPDTYRRDLIYSLPQQFAGLHEVLGQFIEQVFSHSKFASMPPLRGVYLTSGTQEGTVFDRVMGGIKRFLRIDPVPPVAQAMPGGKSFFLKALLQDLIFNEAALAGADLRWYQRRRVIATAGYGLLALLCALLLFGWIGSYWRNRVYVNEVTARVPAIDQRLLNTTATNAEDIAHALPVLDAIRNIAKANDVDPDNPAMRYRWGLFQGDKLQSAADNVYHRALDELLLPLAARKLEAAVRNAPANDPAYAYQALKAYLMLYDSAHYDPVFIEAVLDLENAPSLPRGFTAAQRDALRAHIAALFSGRVVSSPFARDSALVARTRDALLRLTFAQRLYVQLARTLRPAAAQYDADASRMAGADAALVFRRQSGASLNAGVPGLWTFDGYWNVFDRRVDQAVDAFAREQAWVLGAKQTEALTPATAQTLANNVRSLYFDDYMRVWDDYLADLRLQDMSTLAQATQVARLLSSQDSPLQRFANALAHEVSLVPNGNPAHGLTAQAQDKFNGARESLAQIFGDQQTASSTATTDASEPESVVDAHFAGVRELTARDSSSAAAPMSDLIKQIDAVYIYLNAADSALRGGAAPPPSDAPDRLRAAAGRTPTPFRQMLVELSDAAQGSVTSVQDRNIVQSASANIGQFCRQAISGRYPFARGSAIDVTPGDFARLFAPGGMMDDFFQKNLQGHVDTNAQPWQFVGGGGAPFVSSFQNAAVIRDTFFPGAAHDPSITVQIKPLDMDPTLSEWVLDVDGQVVRYAHGPQAPITVKWPGPGGTNQVRLQITDLSGATDGFVVSGPWALLRMFDRASTGAGRGSEQMIASFSLGHKSFAMQVTADSVRNPFRLPQLEAFTCPAKS
ncbi:type VI secretion system membrane subunit TssM [Trinickia soli]|nr:type VI secretion system membrane subunit TssM [Trinickia soli]CAB3665380.1 hypothetical protein LMG24076_01666 [Trinickia soli]